LRQKRRRRKGGGGRKKEEKEEGERSPLPCLSLVRPGDNAVCIYKKLETRRRGVKRKRREEKRREEKSSFFLRFRDSSFFRKKDKVDFVVSSKTLFLDSRLSRDYSSSSLFRSSFSERERERESSIAPTRERRSLQPLRSQATTLGTRESTRLESIRRGKKKTDNDDASRGLLLVARASPAAGSAPLVVPGSRRGARPREAGEAPSKGKREMKERERKKGG
jgi:hypothetical protein